MTPTSWPLVHGPVVNGMLELAVEPETTNLPVTAEAIDELLHRVLWALRKGVKVILRGPWILRTLVHRQARDRRGARDQIEEAPLQQHR